MTALPKRPTRRRRFAAFLLLAVMAVHGVAEAALLSYLHYEMNRAGGGAVCCGAPAAAGDVESGCCGGADDVADEEEVAEAGGCCSAKAVRPVEVAAVAKSCCTLAPEPKPVAAPKHECPCTENGGVCKMGDACRCGKERPAAPAGTFFFELPGCHTNAPGHDNLLLPMSIQIHVTLPPADVAAALVARAVCPRFVEIAWEQVYLPPVTPPPRRARG